MYPTSQRLARYPSTISGACGHPLSKLAPSSCNNNEDDDDEANMVKVQNKIELEGIMQDIIEEATLVLRELDAVYLKEENFWKQKRDVAFLHKSTLK